MTATQQAPGGANAPAASATAPAAPARRGTARTVRRQRPSSRTTPGVYRLWSIVVAVALAVSALTATVSASAMKSGTHRAETNSGPVLVAVQSLVSDLAEADAAATAAFLSGANEDPEQRRLYEQAVTRAEEQIEDIASLAGNDAATHAALQTISVNVTRYSGLVEAGRAGNKAGTVGATPFLAQAVALMNSTIQTDAAKLTSATQARWSRDQSHRTKGYPAAVIVAAVTLLALVVAQVGMARRSRRILNLPLVAGTALVAIMLAWLVVGVIRTGHDIASARVHGYDSIVLTSQLQTTAFGSKSDDTLALITNDAAKRSAATDAEAKVAAVPVSPAVLDGIRADTAGGAPGGLLGQLAQTADTPRERAGVADVADRWQRYMTALSTRSTASASAGEAGPVSSAFNGFNFSVQAVVGQNEDQFLSGLRHAAATASRVPAVALLFPILALLLAFAGFQLRINDYR